VDGGLDIPHSDKRYAGYDLQDKSLDSETLERYIKGGVVAEYAEEMQEEVRAPACGVHGWGVVSRFRGGFAGSSTGLYLSVQTICLARGRAAWRCEGARTEYRGLSVWRGTSYGRPAQYSLMVSRTVWGL